MCICLALIISEESSSEIKTSERRSRRFRVTPALREAKTLSIAWSPQKYCCMSDDGIILVGNGFLELYKANSATAAKKIKLQNVPSVLAIAYAEGNIYIACKNNNIVEIQVYWELIGMFSRWFPIGDFGYGSMYMVCEDQIIYLSSSTQCKVYCISAVERCTSQVQTFVSRRTCEELSSPESLAVNKDRVLVHCWNKILAFTRKGEFKFGYSIEKPDVNKDLKSMSAALFDHAGNIVIIDKKNNRICVITQTGKLIGHCQLFYSGHYAIPRTPFFNKQGHLVSAFNSNNGSTCTIVHYEYVFYHTELD